MRDDTTHGSSTSHQGSTQRRIEQAVTAALAADSSDDPELVLALRAFVDELKAQGTSPEHVLIAVKDIVRRARQVPDSFDATATSNRVAARISSLCIDQYFRTD